MFFTALLEGRVGIEVRVTGSVRSCCKCSVCLGPSAHLQCVSVECLCCVVFTVVTVSTLPS